MGSRIKTKRQDCGLSQEELADKLGMKRTNIANYEAGRVIPPGNVLGELANIFKTSTDYILGLADTYEVVNMTLGSRIREYRIKRGFTQSYMADKLNMTEANFSSYERDKSVPPSEKLSQISSLLGVSTDYLLGKTDTPDEAILTTTEKHVDKSSYTYNFQTAIEEALFNNLFIRGEDFTPGLFVKKQNGMLVIVNGNNMYEIEGVLMVTEGLYRQKYKVFNVANKKELELR